MCPTSFGPQSSEPTPHLAVEGPQTFCIQPTSFSNLFTMKKVLKGYMGMFDDDDDDDDDDLQDAPVTVI
jgi:hypothetical protein